MTLKKNKAHQNNTTEITIFSKFAFTTVHENPLTFWETSIFSTV